MSIVQLTDDVIDSIREVLRDSGIEGDVLVINLQSKEVETVLPEEVL